jgi:DNA-binding transcriptional MerR regulator
VRLDELAERTGLAARQVRYLISEDLVPHAGGTRANPSYDQRHVDAIERYKALRDDGHRPAKIRALLRIEDLVARGGPIPLAPGVHLIVDGFQFDPDTADPRGIAEAAEAAIEIVIRNRKEKPHAA